MASDTVSVLCISNKQKLISILLPNIQSDLNKSILHMKVSLQKLFLEAQVRFQRQHIRHRSQVRTVHFVQVDKNCLNLNPQECSWLPFSLVMYRHPLENVVTRMTFVVSQYRQIIYPNETTHLSCSSINKPIFKPDESNHGWKSQTLLAKLKLIRNAGEDFLASGICLQVIPAVVAPSVFLPTDRQLPGNASSTFYGRWRQTYWVASLLLGIGLTPSGQTPPPDWLEQCGTILKHHKPRFLCSKQNCAKTSLFLQVKNVNS